MRIALGIDTRAYSNRFRNSGICGRNLPTQIPTAFYYIVPLMSFLIDVSWYSLVALVLSADRPRRVYLRLKRRIDIATATVLGALGLRLIATSLTR